MRGHGSSLVAAVCFIMHLALIADAAVQELVWRNVSGGITDTEILRVVVSGGDTETVYANSLSSVYRTIDGGKTWKEILSFRGTGNNINVLATVPTDENIIFAGSCEGLYMSDNKGIRWARISGGIGNYEDTIFSIAVHPLSPETIFIGTGSGFFRTDNNGKPWSKNRNFPSGSLVTSIAIDYSETNIIYAATDNGIYKSINNGIDWKRTFVTNISETEDNILNHDDVADDELRQAGAEIKSIVIHPFDRRIVFAGTTAGLLITGDSGLTWNKAGHSGLMDRDIRHLAINTKDPDSIFAATGKGVFIYSVTSNIWRELYNGLSSSDIHALAFSFDNYNESLTLWAAAKNGIFKAVPSVQTFYELDAGVEQIFSEFANEPTIEEIRREAMIYVEVQPEKIDRWRKAASKKALLPDLRFEFNNNKGWQSSTYFYSTKDEKYKDDDVTSDNDNAWSVSLTWELGDLIWNNDQTSIDTRSRLMVQLRDDILNEITRLYFERRRIQIEMLISTDTEIKDKIDKELRLQELTSDIDALTGSYLSRRLALAKK